MESDFNRPQESSSEPGLTAAEPNICRCGRSPSGSRLLHPERVGADPVGVQGASKLAPCDPPAHLPQVRLTSSMAALRLPAVVSRPTVFAAGKGLLVVRGMTAAGTTTEAILQVALALGTASPARQMPVPLRKTASRPLSACPLPDPTLVAVVAGTDYVVGGEGPNPVDTVIPGRAQTGGTP